MRCFLKDLFKRKNKTIPTHPLTSLKQKFPHYCSLKWIKYKKWTRKSLINYEINTPFKRKLTSIFACSICTHAQKLVWFTRRHSIDISFGSKKIANSISVKSSNLINTTFICAKIKISKKPRCTIYTNTV